MTIIVNYAILIVIVIFLKNQTKTTLDSKNLNP